MAFTALIVVGYIAFTQIAVELMPAGFTPRFLGVQIPYPNSNPQEIEEQITKPVEEQLRTVPGARNVNSTSGSDGAWIFIEFANGADMDLAYANVRDRMDRVKSDLPDDLERIYVRKWSNDDEPILWVALAQRTPLEDDYLLVEQLIKKPLEKVDGVAKVETWGTDEKSILIRVNQDLVKSYKINLYDVIQSLRSDNFAISSGHVTEGGKDIFVRSLGKFKSLQDLQNLPIKGANIRLKDVAAVKYDVPERRWRNKIDGNKAIGIGVYKESMANTVELCEKLGVLFEEKFKKDPKLAQHFNIEVLFNQGDWIGESVDNLQRTALWGGVFAFFILFYFLRRLRMTIIVNVAIPLSILITVIVMYFAGWTLNLITMMGILISIGMVVDNSIVVIENIYRLKAKGHNNKEAALHGASEVGLAVSMATFTTIVVFLPLILMNDDSDARWWMLRIGLPVIIALAASLIIALVFIPLAATRIVSTKETKEARLITKTKMWYLGILAWGMQNRMKTCLIFLLTIASMQFASQNAKYANDANGNINDIRLFFDIPDNYSITDTEKLFSIVEDSIAPKREAYGIRTINSRYSDSWGQMRIFLNKPEKQEWYDVAWGSFAKKMGLSSDGLIDRKEIIADLTKHLPKFPGVDIRTNWRRSGSSDSSIEIALYGEDTNTLANLAREVERRLRSIEEIISLETDREDGNDEIRLIIKRDQAKKYGISPTTISGTIQYALRGLPLPKYHTEDKEVDVHIQLREADRQNLSQLKNITFFSNTGKEIPLDAVADFSVVKGLGEVRRENGKTFLIVKANSSSDDQKKLHQKIDLAMGGLALPFGYSWSKGRGFQRQQESNNSIMFAMVLAITFVFLIMGILFESFVLPLSVILSMPLALVGAFWIMYLTGTPIDFMSRLGFVILIGIVVNNAIVLIDLINRLRREGYSRLDAILEAGKQRFRPILMTAFTTIGGLIPMAVGNTTMIGIPYAPMGRTIIGGLLLSTLLSLVIVPWAYSVLDDMRLYFRKMLLLHMEKGSKQAEKFVEQKV